MIRSVRTWSATLVLSGMLVLALVPAALGYEGEVEHQVTVRGTPTVQCPTATTVTVVVVDDEGEPVVGATVVWSTGATGVTDSNGEHSTSVPVNSATTITATVDGVQGQVSIACELAGGVEGATGLPRTDTLPGEGGTEPLAPIVPLALFGAAAAIAIVGRRRFARD